MEISLYLLCFLQCGELNDAKKHIFTVIFAIWRAIKCRVAHCPKGIFGSLCSKGIGSLCPKGIF